jgi:hypothetical protein
MTTEIVSINTAAITPKMSKMDKFMVKIYSPHSEAAKDPRHYKKIIVPEYRRSYVFIFEQKPRVSLGYIINA